MFISLCFNVRTTMVDTPLLESRELKKMFDGIVANDGISLQVPGGEIRAIIGPNGSGKTTFLNIITGFLNADGGSVHYDGEDISDLEPHKIAKKGLLRTFQIVTPFENMTVRENLLTVPMVGSQEEHRRRADDILQFLELEAVADNLGQELSGGQQKLLELARPLMREPDCLLLDEPAAGINPVLKDEMVEYISMLNEERGITFLIVEHDMNVIDQIADTVTVFDQGTIIASGSFGDVTQDSKVKRAYLGEQNIADSQTEPTAIVDPSTQAASAQSTESEAAETGVDTTMFDGTGSQQRLVGKNLELGYGENQVIFGVSVQSHDGITCVFGPNGSGKSTLLKGLNGTLPLWGGSVQYGEADISEFDASDVVKAGITTLPQTGGVFESLSVEDNLRIGGYATDDDSVVEERFEQVLSVFPELEDRLADNPTKMSGGQQQMLSIGRAMMTGADIYLFDEPSAGLQPSKITDVLQLVRRLADEGFQVILVEQNVESSLQIADHVYILSQGQVQYDGSPEGLDERDELMELYLGTA